MLENFPSPQHLWLIFFFASHTALKQDITFLKAASRYYSWIIWRTKGGRKTWLISQLTFILLPHISYSPFMVTFLKRFANNSPGNPRRLQFISTDTIYHRGVYFTDIKSSNIVKDDEHNMTEVSLQKISTIVDISITSPHQKQTKEVHCFDKRKCANCFGKIYAAV